VDLLIRLGQLPTDPASLVQLNGQDITEHVRAVAITASVHSLTEVTLELIGTPLRVDTVSVPVTQQFLLPFEGV